VGICEVELPKRPFVYAVDNHEMHRLPFHSTTRPVSTAFTPDKPFVRRTKPVSLVILPVTPTQGKSGEKARVARFNKCDEGEHEAGFGDDPFLA
jgi:hypothetical protein